jgi:hypothetical protein
MFDAGGVAIGLELGGMTAFVSGWKAVGAVAYKTIDGIISGLSDLVMGTAAAGDDVQKMAQRIDMSTEALSEMDMALDLAGSSSADFEIGMKGVVRLLDDAADGSATAERTLEKLGKTLNDFEGLNTEDKFFEFVDGLRSIDDASAKAAVAQEAFGKSGQKLIPLINSNIDGARELARQMNSVWTQDEADMAATFQDSMTLAKKATSGLAKTIAVEFLPYGVKVLQTFAYLVPKLTDSIKGFDQVGQAIEWVGKQWETFWTNVSGISTSLGSIVRSVGSLIIGFSTSSGKALGGIFNEMQLSAAKAISFVTTKIQDLANSVLAKLPTSTAGKIVARAMGLDVDLIKTAAEGVSQIGKDYGQDWVDSVEEVANESNAKIEAAAEANKATLNGLVADATTYTFDFVGGVANLVLAATDGIMEASTKANETFESLLAKYNGTNEEAESGTEKTVSFMDKAFEGLSDKASRRIKGMGGSFMGTFQSIVKAGGSMADALGESIKGAVATQASDEGQFHFLSGLAMMFQPGLTAQGLKRMAGGAALMAFGATLGGSGGSSDSSATSGSSGSFDMGNDVPGYSPDNNINEEQKPRGEIIVAGDLWDTDETAHRLIEIFNGATEMDWTVKAGAKA